MDHRAVSDDCYLTTIAQYLALSDFKQLRLTVDWNADAVAARVAHRCWSIVLQHRKHHVAHLAFIFRRHHDDVWNGTKIRDVEQAVMGLPVTAGDPAAVETKLHVQILDADVVYHLIETALQECRVNRTHGLQSFARHSRCKRDAVLLGDANVERTIGKLLERGTNAGAVRHRGSQRHDFRILLHELGKRVAKHGRV